MSASGTYCDWRGIDYRPHIAALLPEALLAFLPPEPSILDLGCNRGDVAFFLARHGARVLGLDLNPQAIREARERAVADPALHSVRFESGDFLVWPEKGQFDAVIMIRLLTCFPQEDSWRHLLDQAFAVLKPGGILYLHDFVRDERRSAYQRRYEVGKLAGSRRGNFVVHDLEGHPVFVAHHHTKAEISLIVSRYEALSLKYHESLSMNGNACTMFEFIGRKALG